MRITKLSCGFGILVLFALCIDTVLAAGESTVESDPYNNTYNNSGYGYGDECTPYYDPCYYDSYCWVDNWDEHIWIDFALFAVLAFLGFGFEHLNHVVGHGIAGHHDDHGDEHGHGHDEDNFSVKLHGIFTQEVTVLGFLSFITFNLEYFQLFEYIQGDSGDGKHGPIDGHAWIVEFEIVHFAIFGSMLLFILSTSLFIKFANQEVAVLHDFELRSNQNISVEGKKFGYLHTMSKVFKVSQKDSQYQVTFPTYVLAKFQKNVHRLVEFNATTWVILGLNHNFFYDIIK